MLQSVSHSMASRFSCGVIYSGLSRVICCPRVELTQDTAKNTIVQMDTRETHTTRERRETERERERQF